MSLGFDMNFRRRVSRMFKIAGKIAIFLFGIMSFMWFIDYQIVQEYYHPRISNNEKLVKEIGKISKVHKSFFEIEDENYNLRVQVTTEDNLKYLIRINEKDSEYFEILEEYHEKN